MLPPSRYLEFHERSRLICSLFYTKYLKLLDTREKRPLIRVALFLCFLDVSDLSRTLRKHSFEDENRKEPGFLPGSFLFCRSESQRTESKSYRHLIGALLTPGVADFVRVRSDRIPGESVCVPPRI